MIDGWVGGLVSRWVGGGKWVSGFLVSRWVGGGEWVGGFFVGGWVVW